MIGKGPIGTGCLDINKGDEDNPNLRSRLVGQEFNTAPDGTLYAATPPLELLMIIISISKDENVVENLTWHR